jgi:hypothetical protein
VRFGRVEGLVEVAEAGGRRSLHLRVLLETTSGIAVVRDEIVPFLSSGDGAGSLTWHADQYTQETIGVQLAEQGWEVIGAGEIPEHAPGQVARSASYAVRIL